MYRKSIVVFPLQQWLHGSTEISFLLKSSRCVKILNNKKTKYYTSNTSFIAHRLHISTLYMVIIRPSSVCTTIVTLHLQDDSKRWTQRACSSCRLYGLNSKRRLNTRQTFGCGIPSSLFALRADLHGLRSKLSKIRLTFSSDTRGRSELLPLHRQHICSNW